MVLLYWVILYTNHIDEVLYFLKELICISLFSVDGQGSVSNYLNIMWEDMKESINVPSKRGSSSGRRDAKKDG